MTARHEPVSAVLLRVHVRVTCSCGTSATSFLTPGPGEVTWPCKGCGSVHFLTLAAGAGDAGTLLRAALTMGTYEEDGDDA